MTPNYTADELREFAESIALKLDVSVSAISLTQKDGVLTLSYDGQTVSGSLKEIWEWVDALVKSMDPSSDFAP
jgi:tetrahydromethanopterin S-methyltransferase subunit B